MDCVDFLKTKRYPGRFIVIGADSGASVVIYGATGRSPASLARRFVQKGDDIFMTAADNIVSKEGNPELLEYPALQLEQNDITVANGNHILDIVSTGADPAEVLSLSLGSAEYEPDEYKTPRITGHIIEGQEKTFGALHIVRATTAGTERRGWDVSLQGGGMYISTYTGEDVKPTPSFSGNPVPVGLAFGSASAAAQAVFDALMPPDGQPDYRVGVIAVYKKPHENAVIVIKNRLD